MVECFFSTARAAAKSSLNCGSLSSCCLLAAWFINSEALRPNVFMLSSSSDWLEAFFSFSRSSSTTLNDFSKRWTSTISAKMRSRVTAERRLRAARTMLPLFNEEHGSSANSLAAMLMASPVLRTSSTADSISCLMSGFSYAINSPFSIKFSVAFSTAATRTWARFDLPFFFFDGPFVFTKVVTCNTNGSSVFSTDIVRISKFLGSHFRVMGPKWSAIIGMS